jgi:hypothetical protein
VVGVALRHEKKLLKPEPKLQFAEP